jgi:two-component system NtrC family sensor kinase
VQAFSYRYAQLRGWALLALTLLVLSILGGMIWRNLDRFETVHAYVAYAHRIQQVALDLQDALTGYFAPGGGRLDAPKLARLSAEIGELARKDYHVSPETPERLNEVNRTVLDLSAGNLSAERQEALLLHALNLASRMLDAETLERELLLEDIGRTTRREMELAFFLMAAVLLIVGGFVRRRILAPLQDLKQLLLRLADADYTPIATARLDPLLRPVFDSYNLMVGRLAELEEAKRHYAASLEAEVRSATRALLEQQASLARTERLAAVGELAAGIAHELRNPLAGIQMSCQNLRNEIDDPDQAERMSLVIEELKRMGRLLNELLDQAKHTPAPVREFNLADLLRELVALTRYQIPQEVRLGCEAPPSLVCCLPECRLRQSLLNLILNAAEALKGGAGRIDIAARREDGHIVLSVSDDGPGFPADLIALGIRPFATGRPGGTGLGLAMVQRFVRELGGQLTLSNREPRGACVRLSIPCPCR